MQYTTTVIGAGTTIPFTSHGWGFLIYCIVLYHYDCNSNENTTTVTGWNSYSDYTTMWLKQCHKPLIWEWYNYQTTYVSVISGMTFVIIDKLYLWQLMTYSTTRRWHHRLPYVNLQDVHVSQHPWVSDRTTTVTYDWYFIRLLGWL